MSRLAIDGGAPVTSESFPPAWHGPAAIGEEEVQAVAEVVRSGKIFRFLEPQHSKCAELERLFRDMTGCDYALAVGGGTSALICALIGLGVGDGDEVIVPAYTYVASASAVLICGAAPIIAEIDDSLTIDPEDVERKISPRTRAIMPVHMRGIPCDMDPILEIAAQNQLLVLEDVAQACGGSYKGRRLGSMGDAGCFSLQQYKIITAGEGGMIVTNKRETYERAAIRHDSAMCFWDPDNTTVTPFPGENFRMNEMEGALGCVQFGRMEGILARCREIQREIRSACTGLDAVHLHQPPDPDGDCGISLCFFLDSAERARFAAAALRAEGIPAQSIYDKSIPDRHIYCYWEYVMQKLSDDAQGRPWTSPLHDPALEYRADMCPNTLDILGRTIILPIFQTYQDCHVQWIIEALHKVIGSKALARIPAGNEDSPESGA